MSDFDSYMVKKQDISVDVNKRVDDVLGSSEVKVPKKPPRQRLEEEPDFSEDEKRTIEKKFIERFKPVGREKRFLLKREHKQFQGMQSMLVMMFAVSVFALLGMYAYFPKNDILFILVLLMGCLLCIPIGMVFGWILIDPFMRCKMMRKTTKRNYGIVNFVSKGRKMVTRIKNFDNDLIWIKNKCWVITKDGVHELDKYGDTVIEGEHIDPDNIVSVTETVPVLFIDLDSMQPLTFGTGGRERIMPEELGSTLKGWIDNQMAKISFLRKTMDIYFVIVILASIAGALLGFMVLQRVEEISETVKAIAAQLSVSVPK
jgi:hypothetical protein